MRTLEQNIARRASNSEWMRKWRIAHPEEAKEEWRRELLAA